MFEPMLHATHDLMHRKPPFGLIFVEAFQLTCHISVLRTSVRNKPSQFEPASGDM